MWLLVVNRKSGKGLAEKRLKQFISICNLNGKVFQVIDEVNAEKTVMKLKELLNTGDYEVIVAFGGDGLISLCLPFVANTKIGLTVVPTGTGNDFARSIGTHKRSTLEIYRSICASNQASIDLAVAENPDTKHYFVQVLSIGLDAAVNKLANRLHYPKGKLKYTISLLLALPRYRQKKYEITSNDERLTLDSMLIAVANGKTYGGGMKISPNASFNDGLLDVLYLKKINKMSLLRIFPRVFNGSHINHKLVKGFRTSNLEVTGRTYAFADGEYVGHLPLSISVEQNALKTWIIQ